MVLDGLLFKHDSGTSIDLGPYLNCPSLYFLINKMGIMVFALRVDIRLRDDENTVVRVMLQNESDYPSELLLFLLAFSHPGVSSSCPKHRLSHFSLYYTCPTLAL